MNPAIVCEALSKRFGDLTALQGINLEIPEGAIFALIGPNGAGKTTLLQTLVSLTPPTSGSSSVLGVDSRLLRGRDFVDIGYVSASQKSPDWMTVGYFLKYLRGFYPTWDRQLEDSLLRQFNLPLDRKLGELSTGMKVKANLTASLAYRPKLLILDEPFSAFDPAARDRLVETLLDSPAAMATTILISTHDLPEVENLASHVGYLESGYLRFAEERDSLGARFRVIEIAADEATARVIGERWGGAKASGSTVQFVDSTYAEGRTEAKLRRDFPGIQDITATPMTLREIFVAIARRHEK